MCLSVALLVIIFILTVVLAVFHYTTSGRKYWLHKNVPYREPCPLFGNFGATFLMKQSYSSTVQYLYDKYRNEKYIGIFQARRPTLMLRDLNIIKAVFSTEFSSFSDRVSTLTDTLREPLLRNLSNMKGAEWKAMRQIVTPTFSSGKMKAMFPLVVECAQSLKNILLQMLDTEIEIPNLMSRFTTDVIGSCAFGVDPGSLKNPNSPFLKMAQKMFRMSKSGLAKRYCRTYFPRLFKLFNFRTYSSDVEHFITDTIQQVLTERRTTSTVRHDFLQLMLNVQKTETAFPMTDELITSNSFIFMLAGLETSATTLSFSLFELARDQELQDRVRTEIKECLAQHGELNYEAVIAMKLVSQCFLESLRMHPPTPVTTRLCTVTCKLPDTDLTVKQGDPVLIPIHSIQRDPQYFLNPDKFNPDRFSSDTNPTGFMAFGEGPRACPGARFAQLIVAAGLAAMLSNFKVEPCSKTTPRIEYDPRSFFLKNKGGIWLQFRSLQS